MVETFQKVDEATFAAVLINLDLLEALLFLKNFGHGLQTLLFKSISAGIELFEFHLIILQNRLGDHLTTFWAESTICDI